jgi:hypothetical protein
MKNKFTKIKKLLSSFYLKYKKPILVFSVIILSFLIYRSVFQKNTTADNNQLKKVEVMVEKNFEFKALNNQGKAVKDKIKFKVVTAEKTNQVLVNEKLYEAKNNKMFLIVHLEYKNDTTQQLFIMPGDLVRLTYSEDKENKFAPDLHNNLISVAAISTKVDRIGFVIDEEKKNFSLIVGELDGDKEEIDINLPS